LSDLGVAYSGVDREHPHNENPKAEIVTRNRIFILQNSIIEQPVVFAWKMQQVV
jgi:hypothetical protein